jgi:thiamine-monophosphate kinase
MTEKELINQFFLPLTNNSTSARGLKDDIACFSDFNAKNLLISSDSIVQGVHLFKEINGFFYGAKLLIRNLSDVIAKCAKPMFYNLNITLPKIIDYNFLQNFSEGLKCIQQKYNIYLIGGDITRSFNNTDFTANITIFGQSEQSVPSRCELEINDLIFVTGDIGTAYLGFTEVKDALEKGINISQDNLQNLPKDQLYYLMPSLEHFSLSQDLGFKPIVKASMDVSDGLLKDLNSMMLASNVSCDLHFNNLPKDANLSFGDDYNMMFSISPNDEPRLQVLLAKHKIKASHIASVAGLGFKDLQTKDLGYDCLIL